MRRKRTIWIQLMKAIHCSRCRTRFDFNLCNQQSWHNLQKGFDWSYKLPIIAPDACMFLSHHLKMKQQGSYSLYTCSQVKQIMDYHVHVCNWKAISPPLHRSIVTQIRFMLSKWFALTDSVIQWILVYL